MSKNNDFGTHDSGNGPPTWLIVLTLAAIVFGAIMLIAVR